MQQLFKLLHFLYVYSLFLKYLPKGVKQFEGVNENNDAANAVDPLHMAGVQILAAGFENAGKSEEPQAGGSCYAADKECCGIGRQ